MQVEFRKDGTFAVPILGKYTLPDQKTVQWESDGSKTTFEFSIAGDTLTLGAGANALQYKRSK
ncbi:MAG: lipocalin family protein [Chloroflexi bacterium]|nr:lipocalin family protein [Chloroflexota bacterium]